MNSILDELRINSRQNTKQQTVEEDPQKLSWIRKLSPFLKVPAYIVLAFLGVLLTIVLFSLSGILGALVVPFVWSGYGYLLSKSFDWSKILV